MNNSTKKPGEMALVALKKQSKAIEVFKKPPQPLKRKKTNQIILTEEKYLTELGKIIQRDFFPDLEKLKAQNEYLDAIASNNISKLREIYTKYSTKRRPMFNDTPATFDTPLTQTAQEQSVRSNESSKTTSSKKSIGDHHSLDTFFEKYTSEDNNSFEEIIEAAEEKLKQKFAILYDAEDKTSNILRNALALPTIQQQFEIADRPNKLDSWTYKNKNYLMYTPEGVDFTQEEKVEMAKRKQEIDHGNTRLTLNPFSDAKNKEAITEAARNNIRGNPEKIGLDGKVLEHSIPEIRGYNFIKSPSPCPSIVDSSPLMVWGEIDSTPFRLDASDTPYRNNSLGGPSFRIAETSKREVLALQLAENVSEKHRSKKLKAIEAAKRNMCASPHIRNTLDRMASMSPAAKRLSNSTRSRDAWVSPSPRISTNKRTPIVRINTPVVQTKTTDFPENESTLTDNLLDIPIRPKAADFF